MDSPCTGYDIAVISVAGRFPGASNVDQFWRNLCAGVESVKFFSEDELLAAGESPELLKDPHYVKAQPVLNEFDRFDASFFGFSPQDAAVMDPQHRVFLEIGWEALEAASHPSESFPGTIGVFATCGMNSYMMYHLIHNRGVMDTFGEWLVRHTGNDMSFLATRLSYELNLKGPSMNVQTACSSALVAVHLACVSLLSGECDMALAGGATIFLPQNRGYLYKPNEILSPDGRCRPFDAKARGTVFGSGAGVVVLRRLADALADGDRILAVVKGSAINNDGSSKVGYLAPSVEGQSKAITEALTVSGVHPETISYNEAHGTATIVGDPIEVVALTEAYRHFTQKKGFCALGSVKSNIGHLGEAAGIAAFIKTVLALQNQILPPSLHYESPNPQIDFANSPFFVNAKRVPWPASDGPRRAGITALGAGGTNCHVIVEEPPAVPASGPSRPWQLLLLSTATPSALETATDNLGRHLKEHPDINLADVAYTLHVGRKAMEHRRALVCRNGDEAMVACESKEGLITSAARDADPKIAFLFPGQGAQYPNMGRGLYDSEPAFRAEVDQCLDLLKCEQGLDLREVVFPSDPAGQACERLSQTAVAQPALFVIEFALAKLWISWGIKPWAMLGHSIGEYVAACLAGVFSLRDAVTLVAERGRLMQQASPGVMLAVALPANEIERLLARPGPWAELSLSVINGPEQAVVGGPSEPITALEAELEARRVPCRRLETSHAFHSSMMDPVLASYGERVRRVTLRPPTIPYLSNLTGGWVRPEEATDPDYWVRHLRHTVRFSQNLSTLLANTDQILLEVGPGCTLGGLARQQPAAPAAVVSSLGRPGDAGRDVEMLLRALGHVWVRGCNFDAARFYEGQRRSRVVLPTYPFERQRFWVEPDAPVASSPPAQPARVSGGGKKPDLADWFYVPTWKGSRLPQSVPPSDASPDWLVFLDECGLGADLIEQLRKSVSTEPIKEAVRLEVAEPGNVESLTVRPDERRQPGPGEVEIHVCATALNFADVLKATGVFAEAPFGVECAGVIERVGPDVTEFRPGDEVVAVGPESFRSYLVRQARHVARKPAFLSMEEAVTLPVAFMTAWYALHHVAKLHRGEKILIHAATGGVGLAAVQVARLAGAEIFATAGSEGKRAFLRSLGLRHVFDSRSHGFAEQIMQRTRGTGVNVVLNSLTGEFIRKGFSVLAAGGRFLELGKRETYSEAQLAALELPPGVSYFPIDLTKTFCDDPETYGRLLRETVEQANQRRFEALPRQVFAFAGATGAFRLMLQTRHIGKVVLTMGPAAPGLYTVWAGTRFKQLSPREFVLEPGNAAHYVSLLEALEKAKAQIGRVAHFWNVTPHTAGKRDRLAILKHGPSLDETLERGFFSLTWFAKAVANRDWAHPISLAVISTGVHQIAGETACQPAKATLNGPCRVMPRELPNLTCRSIDVPATSAGSWQRARLVHQLIAELTSDSREPVVAYRHTDRWVQQYEPAPLRPSSATVPLRRGGVYLITGGLGDLGLALAEHLAKAVQANLVLIGRSSLPRRDEWEQWLQSHEEQDRISEIIRKVRACEAVGGHVLVASADVTDRQRMRKVVVLARKRFGAIHGVIHAAGVLDDGLIQLKTAESALGVLAPKVKGTLVLDQVLGGEPLDFFVLFSTIGSLLGLEGQVDYTAANAFLDVFASSRAARCAGQTVAINWSAWQEVGMAAKTVGRLRGRCRNPHSGSADVPSPVSAASLAGEMLRHGIAPAEGMEAFNRILACGVAPQVIVSPVDPHHWITQVDALTERSRSAAVQSAAPPGDTASRNGPPRGDQIELHLKKLYCQMLGLQKVGLHDDFFDLGGQSLLAIRLVSRVRDIFQVELPLPDLFEAPTIAALTKRIEAAVADKQKLQAPPLVGVARDGDLPLSFAQQRLWFLDQLEPNKSVYNLPFAVRLMGPVDVRVLERSLSEIVRRHEALRTTFHAVEGRPVQRIRPALPPKLQIVDFDHLPKAERESAARQWLTVEAGRPFDLAQDLLLRASLLRLAAQEHVLLLTMHHIASDGWSEGVLRKELSLLYKAFSAGQASPLAELPLQYADYAVWQRQWLQDGVLEQQLAYWKERLKGVPPLLELPTDHPRPALQSFRGSEQEVVLDRDLCQALEELSQREGATLFMTLLAAFQVLLYRYSGQKDIVVGSPIAGRSRTEIEGLIGFFVNTLALRTDVSGNPPFRELLRRVRETTLGAYAHQDLPFEKLVEELQPERTLSYAPLFQVMFALHHAPPAPPDVPGLTITRLPVSNGTAKFDLHMYLVENGDGLRGALEYNTDLFAPETVRRLSEDFRTLLEGIVINPEQRLRELPLVSGRQQRLLADWNVTSREYARDRCIHEFFEAQVELTAHATAVVFRDHSLTYQELNCLANQLARRLRSLGVGPGHFVGIYLRRSLDLVVAMLAILKAGAAYLPMDPSYPRQRLSWMLEDSKASVVLTQHDLTNALPSVPGQVVCLDEEDPAGWRAELPTNVASGVGPRDLAYLMFTSGSTGRPKGVMVEHRNVANLFTAMDECLDFTEPGTWLAVTSICFDISVQELLWTLARGFKIVIQEELERTAADGAFTISSQMRRHKVTHFQCTPSFARILASQPDSLDALRPLRKLLVGGEPLPPLLARQLTAALEGDLINGYGPTETTVYSTAALIDKSGGPVTIGRPLANTQVYIVDEELRPVPVGVRGELCIGGEGVTRGYLNRPDLTAERFIPDRFASKPGMRLYRTGDLARYRDDGRIDFLGRLDYQIKIRGYRIELGEIESVLAHHPAVRECVVMAREQSGEQTLCAYVTARPTSASQDSGVKLWHTLWDATYDGVTGERQPASDPTLNTSGWISSYTGTRIPDSEMREWVEHTVDRIRSLRPRRVLEVGCGTGMLLLRIAPHCELYHGVDFSASVLRYVKEVVACQGLTNVTLQQAAADELTGLEPLSFDVVVVNSVVQYFPSAEYLLRVLEQLTALVQEGGTIFLGDVRSLPLLEAFHTSVALEQAPATMPASEVRQRSRQRRERDNELVLDPAFFRVLPQQLPRIHQVGIQLKRGCSQNELTRFRYDVMLGIGGPVTVASPSHTESGTGISLSEIRARLQSAPPMIAFAGILNPRVAKAVRATELLDSATYQDAEAVRRQLASAPETGIDPEDLYALDVPYDLELTWSDVGLDRYDAVFRDRSTLPLAGSAADLVSVRKPWEQYTNRLQALTEPSSLPLELKELAKEHLPEYMVPASIVLLESLPRTPNGKIDRQALQNVEPVRISVPRSYKNSTGQPQNPVEARLIEIWQDLLNVRNIGVHDSFFELGGHSLLAVRLFARIDKEFQKVLPLAQLFQAPTIARLAAVLRGTQTPNQGTTIKHLTESLTSLTPGAAGRSLVEIQSGGRQAPLFLVHQLGGQVFCYNQLARYLGADQPVYAFQQSSTARHANHASLEAMAASYLQELLAVQSKEPFLLAGHSFGGYVALEMAQQLMDKGYRVALLGIFDTACPGEEASWSARRIRGVLQDLLPWLRYEFLPRTPSQHHARFLRLVRRIKRKTAKLMGRCRVTSREEEIRQVFEVYTLPADIRVFCQANFPMFLDYRPRIYPGTMTVFRARGQPLFSQHQADLGWSKIAAGGLITRVIPGTHDTILREPHVKVLAQELKEALSRL